ncbi:citrate synthase [Myxococcota bacterium]|nr:citrate synthase [Myxococcota bacterium]
MTESQAINQGLDGVVIANSELSFIDGQIGKLVYSGYNIFDLAEHSTFEEVVFLLFNKRLPRQAELDTLKAQLVGNRAVPAPIVDMLRSLPSTTHPMAALRTGASMLAGWDPDVEAMTPEANLRIAYRLVAQFATVVAAYHRVRQGLPVLPPRDDLSHAANFLYMINGVEPDEATARTFDVCLVLHADHGFNASTFSARVTAATLSDFYSAATSAIGTLKGPLHGGANEGVMEALEEIGSLENVEPWLDQALADKRRIMGFGHRVYKALDPRAVVLKKFSQRMGEITGKRKWFDMSLKLQDLMFQKKGLYANVDFYSASTYYTMGIPMDLFTPIFAVSRIAGWSAHILEQYASNRLIRPREQYVGPMDLPWVDIGAR